MLDALQESASYTVNLFGGPSLLVGRQAVRLSPFQSCLIATLFGGERKETPRTRVLMLLWSGDDEPRARRRLNQLLYQTNSKAGRTPLILSKDDLLLPNEEVARSDLDSFRGMLDSGRLEAAALLLRAGFLGNIERGPTRTFEDWTNSRTLTLRCALRDAAAAVWTACEQEQNWAGAREAAEVLWDLEPFEEGLLRHVMWSRAMAGSVEGALSAFHAHAERLATEVPGVSWSPEPETEALYQRVSEMQEFRSTTPAISESAGFPEPRLCGRSKELTQLSRVVGTIPQDALSTILVSGEAGIGKTRLVEEALKSAPLRGLRVFSAQSAEFERAVPLNSILEALDRPEVEAAMQRLSEPWKTVLLALLPQFHHGEGPIPEAPYVQPDSVPKRLIEAFYRLFSELVTDGPVLLHLDDFQWVDETSLAVLQFLRRRWEGGRLLLLLSFRPESKYAAEDSVARFLANAREGRKVEEIELGDLSQSASEDLVGTVAERAISTRNRDSLCKLGGNNPFFLIELTVEHLAGRLDLDTDQLEPVLLPLSVRQVLTRRFDELSKDADEVLGFLAVMGRPMDFREIAAVTDISQSRGVAAIEQLQSLRLIMRVEGSLKVRHELIRQTVYGRLSADRCTWLHERVAAHLLSRSDHPPVDQLALHFHHARIQDKALEFSRKAGMAAENSGAGAEAIKYYTIAREHVTDPLEAAELSAKLGHLHYLDMNLNRALPFLEIASSRLREHGKVREALDVEIDRADALRGSGALPVEDVLDILSHVKSEARSNEFWDLVGKALDVEIHVRDRVADVVGCQSVLKEADELLTVQDPAAQCSAHSILALHLFFGSAEKSLDSAQEAIAIAERNGLREKSLHAMNRLMVVLLHGGMLGTEAGKKLIANSERMATRSGDLFLRFNLRVNVGVYHLEVGELDAAQHALRRAREVFEDAPATPADLVLACNLGELEYARSDYGTASEHFHRCAGLLGRGSPHRLRQIVFAGIGLSALGMGDLGTARRMDLKVGEFPSFWYFDPFLLVLLRAQVLRSQRSHLEAIRLIEDAADKVGGRLVTSWLKLKLEEARLLRRIDPERSFRVAELALREATALGLRVRVSEFSRFVH